MKGRDIRVRVFRRQIMKSLLLTASALAAAANLFAQAPVGSISGTVKDPSGAVIVGAAVTSTSISDAAKRAVTSNEQGYFLIPTLQPGEYRIAIESPGFRNFTVERVSVAVGQDVRVDASLSIGGDAVSIEVAGG